MPITMTDWGRRVKKKNSPPLEVEEGKGVVAIGGTTVKNRCGEGLLNTLNFRCKLQFVVPTRTPLSLLIHSDITQDMNTLSRLQKDYSSHPQESSVENSKSDPREGSYPPNRIGLCYTLPWDKNVKEQKI